MPWSVETPMSQRREFIEDAQRGLYGMRELCARYGISRRIRYNWLARYREWGIARMAKAEVSVLCCIRRVTRQEPG